MGQYLSFSINSLHLFRDVLMRDILIRCRWNGKPEGIGFSFGYLPRAKAQRRQERKEDKEIRREETALKRIFAP